MDNVREGVSVRAYGGRLAETVVRSLRQVPRLAGFACQALELNFRRSALPLKLNLALTYRCQYRCQTCSIWKVESKHELSTDELLRFIDKARFVRWADLSGGEIFLRPDIDDLLDAIAHRWRRLVALHYPTNGYMTGKILSSTRRFAAKNPCPIVVTVSLDGPEPLNDLIRGKKGGYKRQVETFNQLRTINGVKAVFGLTLSSLNRGAVKQTLEALARDCPGFAVDDLHINLMQISSHYYNNESQTKIALSPLEATAELNQYLARRQLRFRPEFWLEQRFLVLLREYLRTGRTPIPCHALRASCFVDPRGVVYPCITYDRPLGNLRDVDMDITRIWRSAETVSLQQEIEGGRCPQCWTACEAYQSILGNLFNGSQLQMRKRDE